MSKTKDKMAERARVMDRIRAAQDWMAGAEDWLKIVAEDRSQALPSDFVDVLLGFVGCGDYSEARKAQVNYEAARKELEAACAEWDEINQR